MTTEIKTRIESLPQYLLAYLPEKEGSIAKTIKQQVTLALKACQEDSQNNLLVSLQFLRKALEDDSYHIYHDFLYNTLLYFCNRNPLEIYPNNNTIPTEFLLLTVDQHCFDIRALAQNLHMEEKLLINPILNKAFHIRDQQRIFNLLQEKSLIGALSVHESNEDLAGFKKDTYMVIKRNGNVVDFSQSRIENAVRKAMLVSDIPAEQLSDKITQTTFHALTAIKEQVPNGGIVHIESIQNCVEKGLMLAGEHSVAHAYILYREKRHQSRINQEKTIEPSIRVKNLDGKLAELDKIGLSDFLSSIAKGLKFVDPKIVLNEAYKNLYDGISYHDLNTALIMVTRPLIENEPEYSFFAARILKHKICEEVMQFFQNKLIQLKDPNFDYSKLLSQYVHQGVKHGYLSEKLLGYDFEKLIPAMKCSRDNLLSFFSLQTLYDRYFIHHKGARIELPQIFFMRVAMGLALNEKGNKEKRAIEYYNLISTLTYMCATPTLFNSGTQRSQLSSCFLLEVQDDLDDIFNHYRQMALVSKWAGGVGTSWTKIRGQDADIVGTNGKSSGVVPFLNIANAIATAVNQGGKRKGAVCAYLETWHIDIYDFLDLRKNSGDERRRTHDMNTANWIPDLFMKRVIEKGTWTLFSPDQVPLLQHKYGVEFEEQYKQYEKMAAEGKLAHKTVEANHLWRKMLSMLYETGHPWITFKCPTNIRNPQKHMGNIHSSNLCTEITLNTSDKEIAVCNLGSINLDQHINTAGNLDEKKLQRTIRTAIRMLDNVVDINYYSLEETKSSNFKHRPIGLGLMAFQDALYKMNLPYDSQEAVEFSDKLMEKISFYAIDASIDLAKERGHYPSYNGSLWDQGILPIDSVEILRKDRQALMPNAFEMDSTERLDWSSIREKLKLYGIRNSNIMAIAPTATIANISNVSQSIEPMYMNLAVKSTLSGEFTIINKSLVDELKKLKLWDDIMVKELKYYDGSIKSIERIPENIRRIYKTAFEVDPKWLIECASRRQKWIDQSQSLNLYVSGVSGKKLDSMYKLAWTMGLKTTYYMRALAASDGEKSTLHDGKLNKVKREEPTVDPKFCSIDEPDCEACQ
jgi:ribonucleoside-diphosphate reductase alpha chain